MKAVVFNAVGDVQIEEVAEPKIQDSTDAIVRITKSAICGTDLHMIRGTMPGMKPGTILGHEGIGIVEDVGENVRNLRPGDRVVIPSTVGCGACAYCRQGYYAQCDVANPNGPQAGTCFFGGPEATGPINGMQAEYVRVPFANVGPVRLPHDMDDNDAILLSDILPTAWFGAKLGEVSSGDVVAVLGAGVVGQLSMASAMLQGAGRVIAIDNRADRLDYARMQGAETINFDGEDPVQVLRDVTNGIGADRVIDAVGVDANHAHAGPAAKAAKSMNKTFAQEQKAVAPEGSSAGDNWNPGDAPTQALRWAVEMAAKAGTIGIAGVYPPQAESFPIGAAMQKNLTINMGNCNHRKYIPELIDRVASGALGLKANVSQDEPMANIIDAYKHFDKREEGWLKVAIST